MYHEPFIGMDNYCDGQTDWRNCDSNSVVWRCVLDCKGGKLSPNRLLRLNVQQETATTYLWLCALSAKRIGNSVIWFQGHCERRRLLNITLADSQIWSMVVPNDAHSPAVLFVAPGPPNPSTTQVVYVASTRSTVGLPAYRDIVPSICTRNRHDLTLVSDDILTPSRVDVEVLFCLFRTIYFYLRATYAGKLVLLSAASVRLSVCLSVRTKSRKLLIRNWYNFVGIWNMVNARGDRS